MLTQRILRGLAWGALATIVMSLLMVAGVATGLSPMPKPIPAALIGRIFGMGLPRPMHMGLAILSHLAYGAFWGGLLAATVRRVTIRAGLALGVGLWLLMQVIVLPFLGWGVFGSAVNPQIAIATLVLHLVYGLTLGWGLGRTAALATAP